MQFINSRDAARKFGAIARLAQSEPVYVQSHGRPQIVILSPVEYERLRRQDRRVYSTSQLPAGLRAAIASAQPSVDANDQGELWMEVHYPEGDDLPGIQVMTTRDAFEESLSEQYGDERPPALTLRVPTVKERAQGLRIELMPHG